MGLEHHAVGRRCSVASLQVARCSKEDIRRLKFLRWRIDTGRLKDAERAGHVEVLPDWWFSEDERNRLRFLRWCVAHGRYGNDSEGTAG